MCGTDANTTYNVKIYINTHNTEISNCWDGCRLAKAENILWLLVVSFILMICQFYRCKFSWRGR